MAKRSAGLIMYRWREGHLEVFLVHPGGPFWMKKDKGAWSIPKGELVEGEEALEAAKREFHEETGCVAEGPFLEIGTVRQIGGKLILAWAFHGDCDPDKLTSNVFQIEWPPRSGHIMEFPEVDQYSWFPIPAAQEHILKSQLPLLDMLRRALDASI